MKSLTVPGPAEVGVRVVDAGVDDGDLDVVALEAEVAWFQPAVRGPMYGTPTALSIVWTSRPRTATTFGSVDERRGIRPANLDGGHDTVVGRLHFAAHRDRPERRYRGLDGVLACLEVGLDRVTLLGW